MKRFLKIAVVCLILTMSLCVFISCDGKKESPASAKKVTLAVWGSEEDQVWLSERCAAFQKENPDVEYKILYGILSEASASDKVLNDPESGPNIFSFPSDQIDKLYRGGALSRLGGDFAKDVKAGNTAESVDAATLTIGGTDQLLAYPITGDNCYFVYYDKRIFPEESDLKSMESILAKAQAAGKDFAFKLNTDGWYLSSFFFAEPELKYEVTYDENMVEQSVDINYDTDPAGLKVMQALRHYVTQDHFVPTTDDSKIIAGFNSGTLAAAVSGSWNLKAIRDILGDNLGMTKLPTANIGGEDVQLSGFFGYKLMAVNGYTDKTVLKEAHRLALYLTGKDSQLSHFEQRGLGPTNKEVLALPEVSNDPMMKAILLQKPFNRTQKGVPSSYWTPMGDLINTIVLAKEDPANNEMPDDAGLQALLEAACTSIRKVA